MDNIYFVAVNIFFSMTIIYYVPIRLTTQRIQSNLRAILSFYEKCNKK